MTNLKFDKEITALLVIDPYNDFISDGGKLWDRLKTVAEANHCVPHMLQVLSAARKAELRMFYALHHRYRPGDYETWKYVAPHPESSVVAKDLPFRPSRSCSISDRPNVSAKKRTVDSRSVLRTPAHV